MSLSGLAGVVNFCFNSLSPFPSIVRFLSSQAILSQIALYAFFPRFPQSTLLPFPSYFKLDNLTYLAVDIMTDDMTIPQQTALNYHIFDLHNNTHPILKNISHHAHHPDHTRFRIIQQNWSNTTLINLLPLL